jgi:hypothetical protein
VCTTQTSRSSDPRRSANPVAAFVLLSLSMACDDPGEEPASTNPAASGHGGTRAVDVATGQAGGGPFAGVSGSAGVSNGAGGTLGNAQGVGSNPGESSDDGEGHDANTLSPRLARYHHTDSDRALHFEIDAVDGLQPYSSSLEYLSDLVARVLAKPDGISFQQDETLQAFGENHVWTFSELDAFSRLHAADDASGPVSIHVLFVDGRYDSGDDGGTVLGLAWGERYIALFQDAIRSGCSGVLGPLQTETCEVAERSVWAHEFGHVIGLVDNGLTPRTAHRDPDHGRHDASDGCLMYWAYDSPEVFDVLLSRLETGQGPDIEFCDHCWADLSAVRQ